MYACMYVLDHGFPTVIEVAFMYACMYVYREHICNVLELRELSVV